MTTWDSCFCLLQVLAYLLMAVGMLTSIFRNQKIQWLLFMLMLHATVIVATAVALLVVLQGLEVVRQTHQLQVKSDEELVPKKKKTLLKCKH